MVTGGSTYHSIFPECSEKEIDVHDIQRGKKETIRSAMEPFQDIQLSLSCSWISLYQPDVSTLKDSIHIIARSGDDERVLADGRFSAWGKDSSGADCLAYIVGDYSELTGFESKGTWLLNMDSGEQRQIHSRGEDLAWAEYDQSFYIADFSDGPLTMPKVQRYNSTRKRLEDTPYHGVDFSPNGTYYLSRSYEGSGIKVYLRASNKDVTGQYISMLNRYFNGNPNFWLSSSMIVFSSNRVNKIKNRIIDFDQSEAWEVQEEVIGFADKEETQLLTLVDGKVVTRKFEDVAKLIYPLPENSDAVTTTAKEKKTE
jgi:WD40 repeat protein